ncbi:MAG: cupin domain-containing protein [Candidatus Baltobacteraceae bacterium]
MKFFLSTFAGVFLTAGAATALALAASTPTAFTPDNLHWVAGTGPSKGSSAAVLSGNPDKAGFAVIRVNMPNGYTNQPHYHAHPEYITVIKGSLLFGTGNTINKSGAKTLPAGSFIVVPAGVHHWSIARGNTIEQVAGQGPQTNIPIKKGGM